MQAIMITKYDVTESEQKVVQLTDDELKEYSTGLEECTNGNQIWYENDDYMIVVFK